MIFINSKILWKKKKKIKNNLIILLCKDFCYFTDNFNASNKNRCDSHDCTNNRFNIILVFFRWNVIMSIVFSSWPSFSISWIWVGSVSSFWWNSRHIFVNWYLFLFVYLFVYCCIVYNYLVYLFSFLFTYIWSHYHRY